MVARILAALAAIVTTSLPLLADDSGPDPRGKPTAYKTGSGKYAVWYDDAGWHIRLSAAKNLTAFHYRLEAVDGEFSAIKRVDTTAGKAPKGKKGPDAPGGDAFGLSGKSLDITSKLGKGLELGFDLKPDAKATAVKFTLLVDDKEQPDLILIGSKGVHPKEATFELPAKPAKK